MKIRLFFKNVLVFSSVLFLVSCGGGGGGGNTSGNSNSDAGDLLSKLVGIWKTECRSTGLFFTGLIEIRNDSTSTNRTDFFSDASCTTPTGSVQIMESSLVIGNEVVTKNGSTAHEIDGTVTKFISNGVEQQLQGPTTSFTILRLEGDTFFGPVPGVYFTPETRATELDFNNPAIRQ